MEPEKTNKTKKKKNQYNIVLSLFPKIIAFYHNMKFMINIHSYPQLKSSDNNFHWLYSMLSSDVQNCSV